MCMCVCSTRQRKRGETTTGKGRRKQEKHKALSSETADRLTGLLRLTETNIYGESKGDEVRERWRNWGKRGRENGNRRKRESLQSYSVKMLKS